MGHLLLLMTVLMVSASTAYAAQNGLSWSRVPARVVTCDFRYGRYILSVRNQQGSWNSAFRSVRFDGDQNALYRQCAIACAQAQDGSVFENLDTGELVPEGGFYRWDGKKFVVAP